MTKFRKMVLFIALVIALLVAAVAPAAAKVNEYEGQHRTLGDPSQWSVTGDPSQWGLLNFVEIKR